MYIETIDTILDSFTLYSIFKEKPYSFILDSAMDHNKLGRYSFIGFDPILIFKSKNNSITIIEEGKEKGFTGNPFDVLKDLLQRYKMDYESPLPFVGGFVGYLGYDLCHHIENLPRRAKDDVDIPDAYLGLYDGIIIIDHLENKTYGASLGMKNDPKRVVEDIKNAIREAEEKGLKEVRGCYSGEGSSVGRPSLFNEISHMKTLISGETPLFQSNFKKEEYIKTIERVKEYIKAGDIYQANLTQRFTCNLHTSPFELYSKLRTINPAPFASFIDFGEGHIVSSSPERFIQIKNNIIETRPIKGTRPRGKTPKEDMDNRNGLLSSEKDRAELLMIVDLERNDLGKIAKTGTVKVTELFHLEEYPTVYHLVATVQAEIREDCDVVDCIQATFPGGSITGAPKIRAMEIIDELEPTQRNIYTGSIGYIGLNGDVDLNIVIRTIVCKEDKAYFQVGGGIVWDSEAQLEYEETLHKGRALMRALSEE